MKRYITILALASLMGVASYAEPMPKELTLGGGGVTSPSTGETEFGFNFTLSAQPLKQPIWFGISQELGWEPSMYGATDLYSDWSWDIVKDKLCLNTGWSVGALYDRENLGWRTGPELTLQYYTSGNAFIAVHLLRVLYQLPRRGKGARPTLARPHVLFYYQTRVGSRRARTRVL